ncbi:hypothetical protein [Nonomuraea sp. NPDC050786]|uniref:hypothetical protein n=1 Tax=Nonomuraea sp. NPDC050786 TaxID=3154840 RepID=UPI003408C74C
MAAELVVDSSDGAKEDPALERTLNCAFFIDDRQLCWRLCRVNIDHHSVQIATLTASIETSSNRSCIRSSNWTRFTTSTDPRRTGVDKSLLPTAGPCQEVGE